MSGSGQHNQQPQKLFMTTTTTNSNSNNNIGSNNQNYQSTNKSKKSSSSPITSNCQLSQISSCSINNDELELDKSKDNDDNDDEDDDDDDNDDDNKDNDKDEYDLITSNCRSGGCHNVNYCLAAGNTITTLICSSTITNSTLNSTTTTTAVTVIVVTTTTTTTTTTTVKQAASSAKSCVPSKLGKKEGRGEKNEELIVSSTTPNTNQQLVNRSHSLRSPAAAAVAASSEKWYFFRKLSNYGANMSAMIRHGRRWRKAKKIIAKQTVRDDLLSIEPNGVLLNANNDDDNDAVVCFDPDQQQLPVNSNKLNRLTDEKNERNDGNDDDVDKDDDDDDDDDDDNIIEPDIKLHMNGEHKQEKEQEEEKQQQHSDSHNVIDEDHSNDINLLSDQLLEKKSIEDLLCPPESPPIGHHLSQTLSFTSGSSILQSSPVTVRKSPSSSALPSPNNSPRILFFKKSTGGGGGAGGGGGGGGGGGSGNSSSSDHHYYQHQQHHQRDDITNLLFCADKNDTAEDSISKSSDSSNLTYDTTCGGGLSSVVTLTATTTITNNNNQSQKSSLHNLQQSSSANSVTNLLTKNEAAAAATAPINQQQPQSTAANITSRSCGSPLSGILTTERPSSASHTSSSCTTNSSYNSNNSNKGGGGGGGGGSKVSERAKKKSWYNVLYPSYKSRSEDFKKLFKDVPDDERLVVDYSCAVQRDILVHGRLYVSQNYLCFYANIFRWETCLSIKWKDVTAITKEKTALVIPNAILVSTTNEKYFITSFTSRDKAYLMLFRVWQNALMDKQMQPQEMWQWVHNCYGDQLGLTSDDEDYIDPYENRGDISSGGLDDSQSSTTCMNNCHHHHHHHHQQLNKTTESVSEDHSEAYSESSSNNKISSRSNESSSAASGAGSGGVIVSNRLSASALKQQKKEEAKLRKEEAKNRKIISKLNGRKRGGISGVGIGGVSGSSNIEDIKPTLLLSSTAAAQAAAEQLPTDMSDSSDSESGGNIPFISTAECNSMHEGRQLVHTILPINVDTLFLLLFSKSKFLVEFHNIRKTTNMLHEDWWLNEEGLKNRKVTLTVALTQAVGPKCSHVTEHQVMRECSDPGQLYSIDITSTNAGIPYADSFYVSMHYCLVRTVDDHTMFSVHAQVKYKKSVWGVVKGFIEKNTWAGLEDFYTSLLRALQSEYCIPPAKSKGRRPRRGGTLTNQNQQQRLGGGGGGGGGGGNTGGGIDSDSDLLLKSNTKLSIGGGQLGQINVQSGSSPIRRNHHQLGGGESSLPGGELLSMHGISGGTGIGGLSGSGIGGGSSSVGLGAGQVVNNENGGMISSLFRRSIRLFDPITMFAILVIISLVLLNVILYFKLWNLESASLSHFSTSSSSSSTSSSHYQHQQAIKYADYLVLKNAPKTEEDWLHLLRQQENSHSLETTKWQGILNSAIELLRKTEQTLADLLLVVNLNETDLNELPSSMTDEKSSKFGSSEL